MPWRQSQQWYRHTARSYSLKETIKTTKMNLRVRGRVVWVWKPNVHTSQHVLLQDLAILISHFGVLASHITFKHQYFVTMLFCYWFYWNLNHSVSIKLREWFTNTAYSFNKNRIHSSLFRSLYIEARAIVLWLKALIALIKEPHSVPWIPIMTHSHL